VTVTPPSGSGSPKQDLDAEPHHRKIAAHGRDAWARRRGARDADRGVLPETVTSPSGTVAPSPQTVMPPAVTVASLAPDGDAAVQNRGPFAPDRDAAVQSRAGAAPNRGAADP
jgi:hypothetical protein